VHERVPGLLQNERRSRYDAGPLVRAEEHRDEDNARRDEAVHIDEVPGPCHPDGMAIAGRTRQR